LADIVTLLTHNNKKFYYNLFYNELAFKLCKYLIVYLSS